FSDLHYLLAIARGGTRAMKTRIGQLARAMAVALALITLFASYCAILYYTSKHAVAAAMVAVLHWRLSSMSPLLRISRIRLREEPPAGRIGSTSSPCGSGNPRLLCPPAGVRAAGGTPRGWKDNQPRWGLPS